MTKQNLEDGLLDAVLDDGVKVAAMKKGAVAERHRQLHQQWVASGKDPEKLEPLLQEFRPVIDRRVGQLKGSTLLNEEALRMKATQLAVKAFESYNPGKSALNTHVQNHLKGALREVVNVQNMARIPEENALLIGKVDRAKGILEDDLGRPPTNQEIAQHAGISIRALQRVQRQRVKDLSSGGSEVALTMNTSPRDREILPLLRGRLQPSDQKIFDLIYEHNIQSTGELARKAGMSPSEVSSSKTRIVTLYNEFK